MRIVLDANITISGLLWYGAPRKIIDAARSEQIKLFSSRELLEELEDVLWRPKLAARFAQIGKTPSELIDAYTVLITVVSATPLAYSVSTDPDDDAVLACALAARAEAMVSGDNDLLTLKIFHGIPILTASALLARLADSTD